MIKAWITGGVMILVVILLRRLFLKKLSKQCFKLLWILAAIRLIVPFFFTVEVDVESAPVRDTQTVVIGTADSDNGIDANGAELSGKNADIGSTVTFLYLLGMTVCGGSMVYAYIRMRRLALGALPVCGEFVGRWGDIDVRYADGFDSPFSCGVIKPIIYLPEHILSLDAKELDMIIAHEKRHIKCHDQLVKWLIAAAVCVNWFDPLAWVMLRLANRDIELACDEAVVSECGERREYALTLIKAAEVRSYSTVCSFGAPVLNERIECIMKSKRITICGFIGAALILGIMSAFFVQISAVKQEPEMLDHGDEFTVGEYLPDNVISHADETDAHNVSYVVDGEAETLTVDVVLTCPLEEYNAVTSKFGEQVTPFGKSYFNTGMNIAAEEGTDVYAAASGTVLTAEYDNKQGNYVVVDHGNGCETVYRHLDKMFCEAGDEVDAEYRIGTVGQTGTVTGPNLGFAIIKDGAYISPAELFE